LRQWQNANTTKLTEDVGVRNEDFGSFINFRSLFIQHSSWLSAKV
jgi:hypothetical protein